MSAEATSLSWTTVHTTGLNVGFIIWKNGEKWLEANDILLSPTWNSSGDTLACGFGNDKGAFVRVGEQLFGPYSELGKNSLVWSDDGRSCAWFIRRGGRAHVVINGQEKRLEFGTVRGGTLALSPDGSRFAVVAHTGFLGAKGAIVIDDFVGPTYLALGVTPPKWTKNGEAVAYCACKGLKKIAVVCDGREGKPHTAFIEDSLVWSPDDAHVSCFVRHETRAGIAVESRGGESNLIFPNEGNFFKGERQFWSDSSTLRDIGFGPDGNVFLLEARF